MARSNHSLVTHVTCVSPLPTSMIAKVTKNLAGKFMDRRSQQRISVELPVEIHGTDANAHPFHLPASLRNISGRGATLQGVNAPLKPGDVVDLQYQGTKAQFRVVWLGKAGTEMQGKVGVENLTSDIHLWDFDPLRAAAATGKS